MKETGRRYRASAEQAYTVSALAEVWRMTEGELARKVAAGEFPGAFKVGNSWRIPKNAARCWRDERTPDPVRGFRPTWIADEQAFTVPDLAAAWKMNGGELARMVGRGEFPGAFKIGRTWRIPKAAARAWREERTPVL